MCEWLPFLRARIVIMMLAALLSGCASVQMYSGNLTEAEIATLSIPWFVSVRSFDGMANSYNMSGATLLWLPTTSKIPSGSHYIIVYFNDIAGSGDDIRIDFFASPRKEYALEWVRYGCSTARGYRSSTTSCSYKAWIEEKK